MPYFCTHRIMCLDQWGWQLAYLPWSPCLFVYTFLAWLMPHCHRLLSKFLYTCLCRHFCEHEDCCYFHEWFCVVFWILFPHLKILTCMYYHQKTLTISIFLRPRSPFLVYFQISSILHRLSLLGAYWLPHWCPEWIFILMETSQPLPLIFSMWLICCHLQFLFMMLILVIILLYSHQYHLYHIDLVLGILRVHPRPCIFLQQSLPKFLLKDRLWGFLNHILCLHSMPCRPKWVFLVPTQTLDIGQRWVVFQFLIVPLPSWQLHRLWLISPNNCCEYISCYTSTWICVLHLHYIPLRQYWGLFLSSMCLFSLCIPWRRIQIKYPLC